MRFHLSNSQIKNLIIRSTPLAIALPAPPVDPPDWLEWARHAIVQYGEHISTVEPCVLTVSRNGQDGDGLAGYIGSIHNEPPEGFCWGVDAVVCHLDPPVKPRRERLRVQWPGCAMKGDRRWPEPKSD
jgi:hypothetical protein